jgi:hypothetical protein
MSAPEAPDPERKASTYTRYTLAVVTIVASPSPSWKPKPTP